MLQFPRRAAMLLLAALTGCAGPNVPSRPNYQPLPDPAAPRISAGAVVLPFRDERPTAPNKWVPDDPNTFSYLAIVPLVPYWGWTAERPEQAHRSAGCMEKDGTDPLRENAQKAKGLGPVDSYANLFSFYLAQDLNQYGPFAWTRWASSQEGLPAECRPALVFSGTLKRTTARYKITSLGIGLIMAYYAIMQGFSSWEVSLQVDAALAGRPKDVVWTKEFTRKFKGNSACYEPGAQTYYAWLAQLYQDVRREIAKEMRQGGALHRVLQSNAASLARAADEPGVCVPTPRLRRLLWSWNMGTASGKLPEPGEALPAPKAKRYRSELSPQEEASLRAQAGSLRGLRVGVGPFQHLSRLSVDDGTGRESLEAMGSGYDFSPAVLAGLQEPGLFAEVGLAADLSDPRFDVILVGEIDDADAWAPGVDPWRWRVRAFRKGGEIFSHRFAVQAFGTKNPAAPGVSNLSPTSFSASIFDYMAAVGVRAAWKMAQESGRLAGGRR